MSTRSAARKAEPWSSFLYSDPEGFQVKTVQFANGATGRGLFGFLLTEVLTTKSFCSLTETEKYNKNVKLRLCDGTARRETSGIH